MKPVTPVMIGHRALGRAETEDGEVEATILDCQLTPDWHGSTLSVPHYYPLTPACHWRNEIEAFETPTVHLTHFIRMGWDSFIWKERVPHVEVVMYSLATLIRFLSTKATMRTLPYCQKLQRAGGARTA
jgi:hypothetical protein